MLNLQERPDAGRARRAVVVGEARTLALAAAQRGALVPAGARGADRPVERFLAVEAQDLGGGLLFECGDFIRDCRREGECEQ